MRSRIPSSLLLPLLVGALHAADPPADTTRGDKLRDGYFRREVERIADASLADVKTKADWEAKRPELRRQFLDMMGLWPLPPRSDLQATITGTIDADNFTVEKLHFQSLPGLYVTANLYVPKNLKKPAPAVLYVCGHGNVVEDNISYGSKVFYQRHPAWFASNGYVCLIVDTLELAEIQGEHHGTYSRGMWWWQALGYTPAGLECWNGMRALDYLQSRKEVDPRRLGITGRSGGGATSWWVAAADERVQCIVPVAGIADLKAHVVEGYPGRLQAGVISGHCDCMYFVNTYRWDFDVVLALCAPRTLLLGNSDADEIFPLPAYRRLAEKGRRIYDLYGAGDHFALLETKGPHKDTPELRAGAFQWMNRWLKNDAGPIADPERPLFKPAQLRVFERLPEDQRNTTIQETFLKPAHIDMPPSSEAARAWWKTKAPELMDALRTRVFAGWPQQPPPLNVQLAADVKNDGLRLRAYDFVSAEEVPLRLWLLTAAKTEKLISVELMAVDEDGWQDWCADLGPAFATALQLTSAPPRDDARIQRTRKKLEEQPCAFAVVAPRGIGPTRWSEFNPFDKKPSGNRIRRRFALLGQTLDGQRVWDVRRALAALRTVPDLKGVPLSLRGKNDMAGIVLYAGLFEPDVTAFELHRLPATHRQGPTFLNVLRVLDMPQAVALALPRKVNLYVKDNAAMKEWEWSLRLQKALGQEQLQIRREGE